MLKRNTTLALLLGTFDTGSDAVVTPPPPITASTAVILIDDVMVTVK
jgi:hypothetical protein